MSQSRVGTNKTYTIREFIEAGQDIVVSYDNTSFIETLYNIKFPVHNVFRDYIEDIKDFAVDLELDDNEEYKYRYKPKLFCQEIYGNTEVYFIIMMLNGIADVKEFSGHKFKVFEKSIMSRIIDSIYNAEKKQIDSYTGMTEKDTEGK